VHPQDALPQSPFGPPSPNTAGPITQGQTNIHGIYVPTQEESQKFAAYIAGGGDVSQVPEAFRAAAYLQAGGDPLAMPDSAKTLILDPARDARRAGLASGFQDYINNPLGFTVTAAVHAWNYLAGQIPSAAYGAWDASAE
jgi:hypothetical protein